MYTVCETMKAMKMRRKGKENRNQLLYWKKRMKMNIIIIVNEYFPIF